MLSLPCAYRPNESRTAPHCTALHCERLRRRIQAPLTNETQPQSSYARLPYLSFSVLLSLFRDGFLLLAVVRRHVAAGFEAFLAGAGAYQVGVFASQGSRVFVWIGVNFDEQAAAGTMVL